MPTADSQTYASLETNIDDYVEQWADEFVDGTKSISTDWTSYLHGLNGLRLAQYTALTKQSMGAPLSTAGYVSDASGREVPQKFGLVLRRDPSCSCSTPRTPRCAASRKASLPRTPGAPVSRRAGTWLRQHLARGLWRGALSGLLPNGQPRLGVALSSVRSPGSSPLAGTSLTGAAQLANQRQHALPPDLSSIGNEVAR